MSMKTIRKTKLAPVAALALSIVSACAGLSVASAALAAPAMEKKTIYDRQGFGKPVLAYTLSMPKGWEFKGDVIWNPTAQCRIDGRQLHFSAKNASGETITHYPAFGWTWGSIEEQFAAYGNPQVTPCLAAPINTAQGFLAAFVQNTRQGAQIVNMTERPDIGEFMRRQAGALPMPTRFEGAQASVRLANGQTEILTTAVSIMRQPQVDMNGGMSGYSLIGMSFGVLSHVGGEDAQLLDKVRFSLSTTPQYTGLLNQHMARMARASRPTVAPTNTGKSPGEIFSDISDSSFESWKRRDAMTTAGQQRSVDGVYDRNPYAGSNGGIVYAPTSTGRVFETQGGDVFATDDPSLEPYRDLGVDARELSPYEYTGY